MESKFTFFLVICFSIQTQAQNLVMNPSFEDFSLCPTTVGELDRANSWQDANGSTSDYFHLCGNNTAVDVPSNTFGFQQPHTGYAYAGFVSFLTPLASVGCTYSSTDNYKEYLQGRLSAPLIAGTTYCVSFWISLADNSRFNSPDVGVYFSNSSTNVSYESELLFTPQLANSVIALDNADTWYQLKWSYVAQGGERFITIGNYKSDATTNVMPYDCSNLFSAAYYYVDDVSVEVGNCSDCNVVANEIQHNCAGSSGGSLDIIPISGIAPYSYQWSNGAMTEDLTDLSSGTYTVTVTGSDGCTAIDTLVINQVFTPTVDAYVNTSGVQEVYIQEGDTVFLASGNNQTASGVSYQWTSEEEWGNVFGFDQIYSEQTFAIPTQNGVYTLLLTATSSEGCIVTDTMRVIVQGAYNGIPNAFTPNGDGINDFFRPLGLNYTDIKAFKVFNRWGTLLYDNAETSLGWDGTHQGREQPTEVYIYLLRYQIEGQEEQILKGEFSLIR